MRLTPDSRAPAHLGLGACRARSSLSLSLAFPFSLSLCLSLSRSPFRYLSLSLSVSVPVSVYVAVSVGLCLCLGLCHKVVGSIASPRTTGAGTSGVPAASFARRGLTARAYTWLPKSGVARVLRPLSLSLSRFLRLCGPMLPHLEAILAHLGALFPISGT